VEGPEVKADRAVDGEELEAPVDQAAQAVAEVDREDPADSVAAAVKADRAVAEVGRAAVAEPEVSEAPVEQVARAAVADPVGRVAWAAAEEAGWVDHGARR
jgi:hypothetical protein